MESIILNNNIKIPRLGLGASAIYGKIGDTLTDELIEKQYDIYMYALKSGKCKLFDTSGAYGHNEKILGDAIENSGVDRRDIFLISKISNRQQDELDVRKAVEHTLDSLHTDYLDLYLIHWPQTDTYIENYKQMEKLLEEGLVRGIGVCNCNKHHLAALLHKANIKPAVNQIEIHPFFTQETLIHYCYAMDIQPIAYTPLGRMHDCLVKSAPIADLSIKYKKTPAQIMLRWHYQMNQIAIPRTLNKKHFDEFFSIDEFELDETELHLISSLNDNIRLRYNPDTVDFFRT